MSVPKPNTKDEMIDQMWFAMVGMNGDGMVKRVERLSDDMQHVKDLLPGLMRIEDHRKEEEEKARLVAAQKREFTRFWLALVITNVVGLAMVVVALFKN
jgi:hypothetical protein